MNKLSYTTKEVVQATGIADDHWQKFKKKGLITPFTVGRKDFWYADDVMALLDWLNGKEIINDKALEFAMVEDPFVSPRKLALCKKELDRYKKKKAA